MRTISTLGDLRGKRVLVRSDFNVPLKDGVITDDGRIRAALPTLKTLTDAGAKVVIMAHLGRPKGQVDPAFSLAPVATRLAELSGVKVTLASDVVGPSATETVAALGEGEIALLENVRYDARETSKVDEEREELAREYAKLGDAFVSDGFGVVLGGSKVSDKLGVIANLLKKADMLFIGGGMAFTFLAAQGYSVGKSLLEADQIDTVKGYIAEAAERGVDLVLPVDVVVAPEFAADAPATVVKVDAIPDDQMGLDIGPESQKLFAEKLGGAKTVAWNGPMGVFEFDAFAGGTRAVAEALSKGSMFSVIGGGDSAAAVRLLGFDENTFSHISTGGGASLELLEGKVLPGIAVLED